MNRALVSDLHACYVMSSAAKLFLFLLVAATLINKECSADSFSINRTDHQLHSLASYGISLTLTRFMESRSVPRWESVLLSSLITLGIGAIKERFIDSTFSPGDMIANGVGVTTQAIAVFSFEL